MQTNPKFAIIEIAADDRLWPQFWSVVESLNQNRYIEVQADHFQASYILVALVDGQPVGFLRFIRQRLGEDVPRPPIIFRGQTLYEAKIIAFGVLPAKRNQGIGRALQQEAMRRAQNLNCCQVRSRSEYGNDANFHLKISLGFGIQPSLENDSVYFVKALPIG